MSMSPNMTRLQLPASKVQLGVVRMELKLDTMFTNDIPKLNQTENNHRPKQEKGAREEKGVPIVIDSLLSVR